MRVLAAVIAASIVASCSAPRDTVLVPRAARPTAMAVTPDGDLIYGERATGRIRTADGELVARVEVTTGGDRGLLGLATDAANTVYASWTRPDGRLVVGAVAPGRPRLIWVGPVTAERGTGGRIARAPDGTIVIGIGDLDDPIQTSDLRAPHGKLLRLDPDGPSTQRPEVVSSSWSYPYAFAFTPNGKLWLADDAPGSNTDRLLRADPTGPTTKLAAGTDPVGLAAVGDDVIVVCAGGTGTLQRYRTGGTRARPDGEPLARDCRLGVVLLLDGRLAYATDNSIKTIPAE